MLAPIVTRLPRSARGFRLPAIVLTAGMALALNACGGGSSHPIAHASERPPIDTIFEAQYQLFANPGPTLDLLKQLGVDDVKVFMQWGLMTPDPTSHKRPSGFDAANPAAYPAANWAPFDAIVRAAATRGIGVDLALDAPAPLWAIGQGAPPGTSPSFVGSWEPSAKDYGLFVKAVGRRYDGHYTPAGESTPLPPVRFWSIWNEPNYGAELAPQAVDNSTVEVSPLLYRELLDAAWTSFGQTGHGGDKLLIGEVAPRGQTTGGQPGNFSGMVPLRFIRALYCVDGSLRPLQGTAATQRGCPATASASKAFPSEHPGLFHATGFAFHPYPQGQVTPTTATPNEPDYADLPKLPSLEATLDGAIAAYGLNIKFPLYDTEFGYQTNPPETIGRAINPTLAAYYMNWAEYITWGDPRVVSWDQYLLTDPPPSAKSNFDTGLEFANGTPKDPMYDAFRIPVYLPHARGKQGQSLEVWGCVRPAHFAMLKSKAPQVASIQFKRASGGAFKTVRRVTITDADGYFTASVKFPSSGSVRIGWSQPGGGLDYSRVTPVTIN